MRQSLAMVAVTTMVLAVGGVGTAAWIPIYDVHVEPNVPDDTDSITVVASGQIGYLGIPIVDTDLHIAGTSVQLDIFFLFQGIGLPVVDSWDHSEAIGTLAEDTYSLTVRTFGLPGPTFADQYTTSFDVVPEPASAVLVLLGFSGLLRRRRKT